ncbi:LysR family transcriptional regulator [Endozoicomonas sp. G2_1]|uniref:LysR family transcriptional regulator n=1 Tax=Endozoicomonas sp. G2_1 TaxID=2821091 RepID=UPI001ADD39D3|nr:LysR family transcriptional regulator [Endozoicomonas sp. G2_1]MBO9489091.1 LysR family transcriptional regulator [Endozoicomonas sp. G2_1]
MREFERGITYTQLITFKTIYEAGNISKAARQLGISSASVSHALKLLEKQIQQPLFIRTTRQFEPTGLALELYQSSQSAIEELSLAVERVCQQNDLPRGKLQLNMAKNIYDVFLKETLLEFQQAYPTIDLEVSLSDSMDDRIAQSFDIGFRFGETVSETLIAKSISHIRAPVKLAAFASANYIEKYGIPQSISQLSEHKVIKFRAPTSGELFPLHLKATTCENSELVSLTHLDTAVVVNNSDLVIDMALNGVGVGYLMDAMIQSHLKAGHLIPVLKEYWPNVQNIYMYYAPEHKQTLRIRCFLDFVNQKLAANG